MRRPLLLPAAALLAALTALALIGTALSLRPPGPAAPADGARETANRALVIAFYEAANAAIATGDLAPLERIVAPDLLVAADPAGADSGPVRLGRRLLALRATDPALRLTVEHLAVDGDRALAHVVAETDAAPDFLGLDVGERPASWGPVDVLRVEAGRVVAHNEEAPGGGLLEPVVAAPFTLSADAGRVVVQRLTLDPGADFVAGLVDGPRLLHVEAGAVAVAAVGSAANLGAWTTLTAGQHLALRPNVGHTIHNAEEEPAAVLDVAAVTPYYAYQPLDAEPRLEDDGVVVELLAGGMAADLPLGPLVVSVGRATLAPNARLAWSATAGPVLLQVEAGTARLDSGVGVAWVQERSSNRFVTLGDDPLPAGEAALVVAGNPAALRAGPDGPAAVLIVTLLPAA